MSRRPEPEPSQEAPLRAEAGDRLVVRGHRVDEPRRDGDIIEVLGDDGAAVCGPLARRGTRDEVFPGSDSYVERLSHAGLAR